MKITDIDISNLRFDTTSARHEGHVLMELRPSKAGAPMHVHFICHSQQEHDCPSSLVVQDLVEDALRQAYRMPGYRRGERKLEIEMTASGLTQKSAAGT